MENGVRFRDGTVPFYEWFLQDAGRTESSVLNVGAGPTPEPCRQLRGRVKRLVGIDPEPTVFDNADLDEAKLFDGVNIPYPSESFDSVFSDWTLEHVQRPLDLMREVHRVLEPGGSFWFRTANLFHYSFLVSSVTPARLHNRIANFAQGVPTKGRRHWATYYRMNTANRVKRIIKAAGFEHCEIRHLEPEPAYLNFSPFFFLGGVAYERLVNGHARLEQLRAILCGKATKQQRS